MQEKYICKVANREELLKRLNYLTFIQIIINGLNLKNMHLSIMMKKVQFLI